MSGPARAGAPFSIDADVRQAQTLPAWVYRDAAAHETLVERVLAPSWQPLEPAEAATPPGWVRPFAWLPGSVDEPLLAVRDADGPLRVLSNVCTHRGNLLVEEPGPRTGIRCGYHGRSFALTGRLLHAPEFQGAAGFPSAADSLASLPLAGWGALTFAALPGPARSFEQAVGAGRARLGPLTPEGRFEPSRSRDYEVKASWIAYVDNYLEGLHIPYVHAALAEALDVGAYRTELLDGGVLQVGIARPGEPVFVPPVGSPDAGQAVGAYYLWLWPNVMLNLYPWGLSLNVVLPEGPERTRVRFRTYVRDSALLDQGAGAGLDRVEHEDEAVVESVQRGLGSRLYERGRYSPSREQGVHAFHRLLAAALAG